MKYGFLKLGIAASLSLMLMGCASTIYQYSATSNPPGAMIYRGGSPNSLSYYLSTPFYESTPNPKGWTGTYFQARMAGFNDSPIVLATTSATTGTVHFELTPLTSAPIQNNLPKPDKISAPIPIQGNSGKYMSPFTAAGAVAPWAQKREAVTDNGSDAAGAVGGAVGSTVANKALDFVPFGLGGMLGNSAGNAAGRAVTKTTIQPTLPTAYEAKLSADLSFDQIDDLAVYMYTKNSAHPEYARVLSMAQQVYPELQSRYQTAIELASKNTPAMAKRKGSKSTHEEAETEKVSLNKTKQSNIKDRLDELNQLKANGYITDAEFKAKRVDILKSL
jgi:hypothetical protein